jgi:methionyl-tRNA formyltransferase
MFPFKLIICGQGHGIECVYRGLKKYGQIFTLCTEDKELIKNAKKDRINIVSHYSYAIKNKFDIVLTAAYKPKISNKDLALARFLNIHYALLPKYRGMHALVWAMLNGETNVGFTVHETSGLLDQGPIIYQESLSVENKTSNELMQQIDELVEKRIFSVITDYINKKIVPVNQNEKNAIYVAPRNLEDCRVQWEQWDAKFFSRALKALIYPYPLPFFYYKDKRIEILDASIIFKNYCEINGHLVYLDHESIYIKIPGGLLKLKKIVIGKKIFIAPEYFRKIGLRFK